MTDKVVSIEEIPIEEMPGVEEYLEAMGEDGLKQMLEMVNDFSEEFRNEWSRIRARNHNPGQKGDAFQDTLKEFLELYFSSVIEFRTGCSLMDSELRCFKEFTGGGNEFDVVGSFRTAIPHVVFEEAGMYWIPYAGVALLCEVKSKLNKQALDHDLEKLDTLARLRENPKDRFGVSFASGNTVNHQLHCLVYDAAEINEQTRQELLYEYPEAWDLILLVDEDKLLLNSTLPVAERIYGGNGSDDAEFRMCHINNGLLWFIISLTASMPQPALVNTTAPLVKMATFLGTSISGGYFKQQSN
ncbi:DUF6602 domain-containing protein [Haloarcula amylolytica]|uniref:DUF6602 domain-containing protein n=1 Tax=Haloarcula amylolytica TaxID=396317 RepID=UPI003C7456F7